MGGNLSTEYKRFREYCFNAYLILRRYSYKSDVFDDLGV